MKHSRSIQRRLTEKIYILSQYLSFLSRKLSFVDKLCVIFLSLSGVALFLSWCIIGSPGIVTEKHISHINSFSPLLGNIGFFFFPLIILSLYKIISLGNSHKRYLVIGKNIQNYQLVFWVSIILLCGSLHSYCSIRGLGYFDASIQHSFGLILSITSAIMLLGISFLMQKQQKNLYIPGTFIGEKDEKSFEKDSKNTKENMKLPV